MVRETHRCVQDAKTVADAIGHGRGASDALAALADGTSAWIAASRAVQNPESLWLTGLAHEHTLFADADPTAAPELYEAAAAQHYPPALYQLARTLQLGKGTPSDPVRAVALYREAAELGFAAAMCNLGVALLEGEGTDIDVEAGLSWLIRAAEADNAVAQVNLGACYADGDFVAQSPSEAVRWYTRAAELGHRGALCLLGMCYEEGLGVPRSTQDAARYYHQAAEAGDIEAQLLLGFCYEEGTGVPRDLQRAAFWYQKGAEGGDPHAQVALGGCCKRGEGVDLDPERAVEWFQRAAEQGDAEGHYQLGICLSRGEGAAVDYERALTSYLVAAEQGHPDAHYCLGVAYSRGDGVERNLTTAFEWFDKAAALGSEIAAETLRNMNQIGTDDPCAIVGDLLDVVQRPIASFEEAKSVACGVMQAGVGVRPQKLNDMMRCLSPALLAPDVDRAGVAALVCGALVEYGGAPNLTIGFILDRLPEVLDGGLAFIQGCRERARESLGDDADEAEVEELIQDEVLQADVAIDMLEESRCWHSLDFWCQPAIALLCRDAESRRQVDRTELVPKARALASDHRGAHYLLELLQTLDEESLLVLVPASREGFRVSISGVSNNFQLHTLLADALIGPQSKGLLPGVAPEDDVVEVATGVGPQQVDLTAHGRWDLYNWRGLRCDLTLPEGSDGTDYWVWNEGVPADIPCFDGTRVLLLAPASIERSWNASRTFGALRATVALDEVLSQHEVQGLLQRMAGSADRVRPA